MIALALVWLRAAGLAGQALAFGGALLALVALRPARAPGAARALHRTLALVGAGALLTAVAQVAALGLLTTAFADDAGWPLDDVLGSTAGLAGLARIAAAIFAASAAWALRRTPGSAARGAVLLVASAALPVTGALASHAMGRMDAGSWLVALSAVHQAAASAWVGGLVAAAALAMRSDLDAPDAWLRPFSALAAAAVAGLALTGIALALEYVATPGAAIGTSYGAMVLTKLVLFIGLLTMGALNHRALHGLVGFRLRVARAPAGGSRSGPASAIMLRRRVEVEAGLAVVTLFLAASIGAAPPAADMGAQQASLEEVRTVFTPRWPRLETPSLAELAGASALTDASAPRTPEDTAWSEFGHNVSGIVILAMGVLATLAQSGGVLWARHWPLLLIGLAAFLAWRMDPEGWQTGLVGFWEQLWSAEVLQHRALLAITALFGLAEWRVRNRRGAASAWRYVFPVVCIAGGIILLSHAHDVSNAKTSFFMEVTHLPLGLLSLVAGWSRWLELRLPPREAAGPGRLWGPALAAFGLLLVFYREG